jgi:hypothetical protein
VGKVSAAWRKEKAQICRINTFHFKCYIGRSPFGFFTFHFHFLRVSTLVFYFKCGQEPVDKIENHFKVRISFACATPGGKCCDGLMMDKQFHPRKLVMLNLQIRFSWKSNFIIVEKKPHFGRKMKLCPLNVQVMWPL